MIRLVSIELTNRCRKACEFCYAKAGPEGETFWEMDPLADFIKDLADNGIEAVSLGGGEPMEYPHFWELLDKIREISIFKSMTTNGLEMGPETPERLAGSLQKVHVSIHRPSDVPRAILQVLALSKTGIRSGVNFLVTGEDEKAEMKAAVQLQKSGLKPEQVVFLPLRGGKYPAPSDYLKLVASKFSPKFQSTFCLLGCKTSDRFVSVDWQGRVGHCSYTPAKTKMEEFTYQGMMEALRAKEMVSCG